jgi:hypothetical protein
MLLSDLAGGLVAVRNRWLSWRASPASAGVATILHSPRIGATEAQVGGYAGNNPCSGITAVAIAWGARTAESSSASGVVHVTLAVGVDRRTSRRAERPWERRRAREAAVPADRQVAGGVGVLRLQGVCHRGNDRSSGSSWPTSCRSALPLGPDELPHNSWYSSD